MDMKTWKKVICSTSYGSFSKQLAVAIATLAKHTLQQSQALYPICFFFAETFVIFC